MISAGSLRGGYMISHKWLRPNERLYTGGHFEVSQTGGQKMGKVFTHEDVQTAARTSFAYEEAGDARQVRNIRRLAFGALTVSMLMIMAISFYIGREMCHAFV